MGVCDVRQTEGGDDGEVVEVEVCGGEHSCAWWRTPVLLVLK